MGTSKVYTMPKGTKSKNEAKLKALDDVIENKIDWKTSPSAIDRLLIRVDKAFKSSLIDGRKYDYYIHLIYHTAEYP